ncbi:MAG: transcriptional regulator [Gammaproteobacteria bacterium]|nr:transcriptional regulator [Gammaproteobacteria bacterium]
MDIENEKREFSKRLKQALDVAGFSELTLSALAIKFNLQHPNKPVTPQTIHNWLIGASMPSSDKIETLANLLKTSPVWLRYGKADTDSQQLTHEEVVMLKYFRKFPTDKQRAIISLLHTFQ